MAFSRIPSPSGPSPIPAERIARRLRENTFSSSRVVVSVAPGAVAGGKRDHQSPVAGGAGGVPDASGVSDSGTRGPASEHTGSGTLVLHSLHLPC